MSKRTKASVVTDPDAPRKLTETEIERILQAIPYPHAITQQHAAFAREQILRVLRAELAGIELAPSGLDELSQRVITQFEESRVKPGSMVGFAAAEAPSQRFSQDNLSAVHRSSQMGMRGTGGAVGRISELVSKQQSKAPLANDSCNVFFNSIQTQHSILHDKRSDMVAVNIAALLRVEEPYNIEYQANIFPEGKLPVWYNIFSELYGVPMPELSRRENAKVLRLYLDVEKVVEYRVMLTDLRRALMRSNSRILRYYIAPMHMGIVDIWALDEEFHAYGFDLSGDVELDVFNCLHGFAVRLGVFLVKGIPGIRDVQAAKFDIWPIMTMGQAHRRLADHVYEYRLTTIWRMRFGWERPRQLWEHLGIIVRSYDEKNSSWVVLDGSSKSLPPHEIIAEAVKADEKAAMKWQEAAVGAGKSVVTRPVTPANTLYWSQLWYAKTDGTNLREILVRDDVESRYTVSNRPFEVLELYGIVAARRVMLEELYLSFGGGREEPNFSVRHFSILADFVCHTGVIRPISNLLIQGRSTLSKATFARQFTTLVTPAIHGVDEPLGDVSAAIMVATRAKIGPRAFEYEGTTNKSATAEEIKNALRAGSRSLGDMDAVMAAMTDTADAPLYYTGTESAAAAAAEAYADEDAEAEAEYEAEAAGLPPGLDDEEGGGVKAASKDKFLIIDDEDGDEDVEFVESKETVDEKAQTSSRRRRRSAAASKGTPPIMAPALRQAVKSMGGSIEEAPPLAPPPPVCQRVAREDVPLVFVDDE